MSPEKVAYLLASRGVRVAALTDHNTLAGQERFRAALEARGMQWLSGVEVHVESSFGPLHLLAYGCDIRDRALTRVLRMLCFPVWGPLRHWMEHAWTNRPGKNAQHAKPEQAEVTRGRLDVADALRIIHHAGGRAFLAHPMFSALSIEEVETQVRALQPLGLDGIEAFYKPYPPEISNDLCDLALRHDLLVSGGSDFHGPTFPADGPGYDLPDEHWQRFATALGLANVGERT